MVEHRFDLLNKGFLQKPTKPYLPHFCQEQHRIQRLRLYLSEVKLSSTVNRLLLFEIASSCCGIKKDTFKEKTYNSSLSGKSWRGFWFKNTKLPTPAAGPSFYELMRFYFLSINHVSNMIYFQFTFHVFYEFALGCLQ